MQDCWDGCQDWCNKGERQGSIHFEYSREKSEFLAKKNGEGPVDGKDLRGDIKARGILAKLT